jgi:hypothetical protein
VLFDYPVLIVLSIVCWSAAMLVLGATLFFRFGTNLYDQERFHL